MATEPQSTEVEQLNKEDIIDLLNEDDVDTPPVKEEVEEKVTKEGDEEEEVEEEVKEEKIKLKVDGEDDLEDEDLEKKDLGLTPAKRAEILKQFPEFFKKFPEMERSYYRDKEFTEIYATPAEAKEAQERAETLGVFEQQLANGDIKGVLAEVKKNDPRAFSKLADNYMAALHEVDPNAQLHITAGVVKGLIVSLVRESESQGNEELKKIALAINQFAFGSSKFQAHTPLNNEKPEDKTIQDERNQFLQERYEIAVSDLDKKVTNILKATITEHIDPKGLMTEWAKGNAVKEALEGAFSALRTDPTFRQQLNKLWKNALSKKVDHASTTLIKQAYLNKAQTILGKHIKTARNNALKGLGKKVREDRPTEERQTKTTRDSSSSTNRGQKSAAQEKYKGMSTLDALNQE